MRLLDQAIYLDRDGLNPAFGMDEGGMMDAIGARLGGDAT